MTRDGAMRKLVIVACYVAAVTSQGIASYIIPPSLNQQEASPDGLKSHEPFTNLTIDQIILQSMGGVQKASDMVVEDTTILAELDMKLTSEQFLNLYEMPSEKNMMGASRRKRKAVRNVRRRWTNATLPYQIVSSHFDTLETYWIKRAMTEWERYTCMRFKEARSSDRNSMRIQNGYGCNSQLGMVGGVQLLNLENPGCRWKGLYLHEIGHALGLVHEHQLPTRDNFIRINYPNVLPSMRVWFNKYNSRAVNQMDIPYEYSSVMHYGTTAFSYDGKSQTIHALQPEKEKEIGKVWGKELAFSDVKSVSLMYKCSSHCSADISCTHGGFVNQNCECTCVDGSNDCQVKKNAPTLNKQKLAPSAESCTNVHKSGWQCAIWANQGECDRNPDFMESKCKKACHGCGDTDDQQPNDLKLMTWGWQLMGWIPELTKEIVDMKVCKNKYANDKCNKWTERGDCLSNPSWMKRNCRKACRFCQKEGTLPEERCQNNNMDDGKCRGWALDGQCKISRVWMMKNCRRACRSCNDGEGGVSTLPTTAVPSGCINSFGDEKCLDWADSGECTKNPEWMPINCAKACGKCNDTGKCANIVSEELCKRYAKDDDCVKNLSWMTKNCKLACGMCKPEKKGGKEPNCKNKHRDKQCDAWAKGGHCRVNPSWMEVNCARSCDTCPETTDSASSENGGDSGGKGGNSSESSESSDSGGDSEDSSDGKVVKECVDRDERCAAWAKARYCENHMVYMLVSCRKSCNNCANACKDINSLCPTWGKADHCASNPSFMLRNCQETCRVCLE